MDFMSIISMTPVFGHFGFNIKYDDDDITIPGYKCNIDTFLEEDDDTGESELRTILEEDFGCSAEQVNLVKYFLNNGLEGSIDQYQHDVYEPQKLYDEKEDEKEEEDEEEDDEDEDEEEEHDDEKEDEKEEEEEEDEKYNEDYYNDL